MCRLRLQRLHPLRLTWLQVHQIKPHHGSDHFPDDLQPRLHGTCAAPDCCQHAEHRVVLLFQICRLSYLLTSLSNAVFFSYYKQNPVLCQLYSFFFYWSFLALLLIQVALAVNRWTTVCCRRLQVRARTSLVAGCLCWLLALVVCLLPVLMEGTSQFGWDHELGQFLSSCQIHSLRFYDL